MLEDEAGFVHRDKEFVFRPEEQAIGPAVLQPDNKLTYSLALPSVPQGTFVDVDNNGQADKGIQVFAVAYWSNTWGGPFLETRDGKGWSNAYTSAIVDAEKDDEIVGGKLVVWAPDDGQKFPSDFGPDGLLFTADDPVQAVPAGYSIVDLDQQPFRIFKEAQPDIVLNEGVGALNDYSQDDYSAAFENMYKKMSLEYPFTELKNIDWQALHQEFAPRFSQAQNKDDFFRTLQDFALRIPDGHVGYTIDRDIFLQEHGGGFGMVLAELSDGSLIVQEVLPDLPAARAGIQPGAELLTWDGKPVGEAVSAVVPFFGPSSTPHALRRDQVSLLTHVPPATSIKIGYRNPGDTQDQQVTLRAANEVDSFLKSRPDFQESPISVPVEAQILPDSGLGYIRIHSFLDDTRLTAYLWDRYIRQMIDNKVPGLIIDVRTNPGGSGDLANQIASYFFDHEIELYTGSYYNDVSGKFEAKDRPARITPAPLYYSGPVAVLVSSYCDSACEGFAYALAQEGRSTVVGNTPTAGMYGEVGQGQFKLPDDISIQFPTGRSETADGKIVIEGTGVVPDVTVPVTAQSVLSGEDTVLKAAVAALQDKIK